MRETRERNPEATRQRILEAAYQEMYRNGFQAASVEKILRAAGVAKGALYHHFGSKIELGYAVVDEILREGITGEWLRRLGEAEDPLQAIVELLQEQAAREDESVVLGCPLNNLAQEMSAVDEGFRRRLESCFCEWRIGMGEALRRAQVLGLVRPDVDPNRVAGFIVGLLEGTVSLAKSSRDRELLRSNIEILIDYLGSLRAEEAAA